LAAYIEGSELDTYDLDMEIAFNAILPYLDQNGFSLLALSAELGLVPLAGARSSVENALSQQDMGDETLPSDNRSRMNDLKVQRVKGLLANEIARLNRNETPLKVHFATEDWDDGGGFKVRPFSINIDFEITTDLLRLILPLARFDREVTVDDPRQVRIATAFAKKILVELGNAEPVPSGTSKGQ